MHYLCLHRLSRKVAASESTANTYASEAAANRKNLVREPRTCGLRRPGLTAAMSLFVLAIYLLFPVKDYFFDGIYFAQTIEDSHRLNLFLFHPNHLLYTATGYMMYRGTEGVGVHARALDLLVLFNTLMSALAAAAFMQILLEVSSSSYLSCVLTLGFAFSATWWRYSPNADAYVPAIFFLIVCFYLILPNHRARPVSLALTHSLAMLFHQMTVMFYPVAIAGIWLQGANAPLKQRMRRAAIYTAVAAAVVISAYCLVFRLGTGRLPFNEFHHWVMFHDPAVGFEFNFAHSVFHTLHGSAQLLFATKLSYARSELLSKIGLGLAILLGVVSLLQIVRYRGDLATLVNAFRDADRVLLLLPALWIVTFVGFLFFWVPSNQHYRPFYSVPIFLLIAIYWSPYEHGRGTPRHYRAILLVAAYALLNFSLLILPLSRPKNTPTLVFAGQMRPLWPPGTVVYYADYIHTISDWTMRYFNAQTVWREANPGTIPVSDAELEIIYRSGGTVWFDTTLSDVEEWREPQFALWLRAHTHPDSLHAIPAHGWNVHFLQIFPPVR